MKKKLAIKEAIRKFTKAIHLAIKMAIKKQDDEREFQQMDLFEKIIYIMELPFAKFRSVCLPSCDPDEYCLKRSQFVWFVSFLFLIFYLCFG